MRGGNALEQHRNNIITKYIQLKKKKKTLLHSGKWKLVWPFHYMYSWTDKIIQKTWENNMILLFMSIHTCFTFIDGDREWLQICPFAWKIERLCVVAEQKQYMTLINLAIPPVSVPIADRKDKSCAMQALLLPSLSRWNLLLFVHLNKRRFAEKKQKKQVELHETWWRDGIKGIKVWLFRKISTFF